MRAARQMSTSDRANSAKIAPRANPVARRKSSRSIRIPGRRVGGSRRRRGRGRGIRHDPAEVEHHPAVGDRQGARDVLLGEQHGESAARGGVPERPHQLRDDERREPERRLVEREQHRVGDERAADREHLALASRELVPGARAAAGERLEQLVDAGDRAVAGRAAVAPEGAEAEVLVDRELGDHALPVGHEGEAAPRPLLGAESSEVVAVEQEGSGCRGHESCEGAQERRLAGAVRTEQRHHLTRREREPDAVEHRGAAVADGEVADLERAAVGDRLRLCGGAHALAFTPR